MKLAFNSSLKIGYDQPPAVDVSAYLISMHTHDFGVGLLMYLSMHRYLPHSRYGKLSSLQ